MGESSQGNAESVYPEELKEIAGAALHVASLKHQKVSPETASALHGLKLKFAQPQKDQPENPTEETVNFAKYFSRINPKLCLPLSTYSPPDIPPVPSLNGLIGRCSKPFVKQLTESDVNFSQCRLSITKKFVEDALKPLFEKREKSSEGIPVKVYDAKGKEYPMTFICWSDKFNVLKEGWINFCNDHSLLAYQDFITMWAFRNLETHGLSFVITSRRYKVFEPINKKRRRLKYYN